MIKTFNLLAGFALLIGLAGASEALPAGPSSSLSYTCTDNGQNRTCRCVGTFDCQKMELAHVCVPGTIITIGNSKVCTWRSRNTRG